MVWLHCSRTGAFRVYRLRLLRVKRSWEGKTREQSKTQDLKRPNARKCCKKLLSLPTLQMLVEFSLPICAQVRVGNSENFGKLSEHFFVNVETGKQRFQANFVLQRCYPKSHVYLNSVQQMVSGDLGVSPDRVRKTRFTRTPPRRPPKHCQCPANGVRRIL